MFLRFCQSQDLFIYLSIYSCLSREESEEEHPMVVTINSHHMVRRSKGVD